MRTIPIVSRVTDKENPLTWQARIAFWAIRIFATKAFRHIFFDLTVSAIDGVIYHPVGRAPSFPVLQHEEEHIRRAAQTRFWQLKYLLSPSFRLEEEVIAYQWNYDAGLGIGHILDVLVDYYSTGYDFKHVARAVLAADYDLRVGDILFLQTIAYQPDQP